MPTIDDTAKVVDSEVGRAEIREFATIHDADIGDGCRLYERTSIKKSRLERDVDVNAGTYVENAEIGPGVQIGPNCSVVGVTHELREDGMAFRDDVLERIVLGAGAFLGAGSVVGPGLEIGEGTVVAAGATVTDDIGPQKVVLGSPPTERIVPLDEWLDR
ncbi:DapH/DapD/GlmU-related protein [Natronococcus sp. A-GB1]|uniref:acyltransferase n=1 Tax=Natronococcus sp. A-GB1 TaxID=3037648 RepID=UPI00241EF25A|nr:DapH/DapD/GlmU-related protein [Natronococcus sp. A-GB1]MDG5758877.1 DapH/DapD/GlmU-related protein [Natronococcus sp. A-GB1]